MAENKIILHLGSNIGDKIEMLNKAIQLIREQVGPVQAISSYYKTEAWGIEDQDDFINVALSVNTTLRPLQVLKTIHDIENALGRRREEKWGPRLIDIDILLYDDLIIQLPGVSIPHPGIPERNFVLAPLAEIEGELIHPILGKDILALYNISPDKKKVVRLNA